MTRHYRKVSSNFTNVLLSMETLDAVTFFASGRIASAIVLALTMQFGVLIAYADVPATIGPPTSPSTRTK